MDIKLFYQILKDPHLYNYKKMSYKYALDFDEFLKNLDDLYYENLSLKDFDGADIVYTPHLLSVNQNAVKYLLRPQSEDYGAKAAEDEIISTSAIESIDFSRDSVRSILKGFAPKDEHENRIAGLKEGLEFIADVNNKITKENIYKLYMMSIGNFLTGENKLKTDNIYRHDTVYVMGAKVEHSGIDYHKIPKCMDMLISFANKKDNINDLVKACIIHFYLAYIHPYFDGNGRMARLIHLWFLVQRGYHSALFIPFSSQIEKKRRAYYDAFTAIEENKKYSHKIDVTPFIIYFMSDIYSKINENQADTDTFLVYKKALKEGKITEKETKLWGFVLSHYASGEFSTKQLEKDFGNAAYATIRSFVLKFEELGLLSAVKYGVRIKYKIANTNL